MKASLIMYNRNHAQCFPYVWTTNGVAVQIDMNIVCKIFLKIPFIDLSFFILHGSFTKSFFLISIKKIIIYATFAAASNMINNYNLFSFHRKLCVLICPLFSLDMRVVKEGNFPLLRQHFFIKKTRE